jgi:hypothetical protein
MQKKNNIDRLRENSKNFFENFVEYSVDGIYKSQLPINSNISCIKEIKGEYDKIFYINYYKNLKFGISEEIIENLNMLKSSSKELNSHYIMPGNIHLDPYNWNLLSQNKKEIEVTIEYKNNISKKIKMIETNSRLEIENAKNIISSEQYSQICNDFRKTLNKNPSIKNAMKLKI